METMDFSIAKKICVAYNICKGEDIMEPIQKRKNAVAFADAINSKVVYIEVCSNDATIRSQYEGYYHHNENQTCFINNSGLTLPYDGINRYYNVYSVARF